MSGTNLISMMKSIMSAIVVSLFTTLSFTECKKDNADKVFNANFFTTKANGKLTLYVDDVLKGDLTYFSQAPTCEHMYGDGAKPLTLQLKSGEYKIVGKNEQGQVTSLGTMIIGSKRMSVSGGIGGQSLANNGDCLAIGLSEK